MKRLIIFVLALAVQACTDRGDTPPATGAPNKSLSVAPYTQGFDAQAIEQQCQKDLENAHRNFAALEELPPPYTVQSVLKSFDQLFISIENGTGMVFLLSNVDPDEQVRKAADECIQQFSSLISEIGLSTDLFKRALAVDSSKADSVTQRYHQKMLSDFRRSGVDKDKSTREKISELNEEIVKLGQDFARNIRKDVRSIKASKAELNGLPQDYIEQHPFDEAGYATITTDYPDVYPYLRYAHDDGKRLAIYKAFINRGYPVNQAVLKDIIVKRYQLARLLGYKNYAEYVTEDLMVKNPQVAGDFIERISALSDERSQADYSQLLATLQTLNPDADSVGNWQKAYLEELVRNQQYDVDTREIRQYFQYSNVTQGIFQLMHDLFGIDIKPWDTPVWHKSVKAYQVWDGSELIGQFYLDMHPRPGKYGHAAQFGIRPGVLGQQLPVAALVCNFPGESDASELMEHQQVETFLHEFGHLIHSIFGGQQQWATFSGVATERDFVEAPSQMLEEWIWDYDTLKQFARNKQGEVIPAELVDKMLAARSFAQGTHTQNQMFYAALSLEYYQLHPEHLELDEVLVKTQTQYSPFAYIDGTHFYASFGHLDGYSAAYYTYMWSEVIAADILAQFKKQGMRNQDLAQRYRDTILSPGGSKDADKLLEDFLGRPVSFDAYIERLNGVQ